MERRDELRSSAFLKPGSPGDRDLPLRSLRARDQSCPDPRRNAAHRAQCWALGGQRRDLDPAVRARRNEASCDDGRCRRVSRSARPLRPCNVHRALSAYAAPVHALRWLRNSREVPETGRPPRSIQSVRRSTAAF